MWLFVKFWLTVRCSRPWFCKILYFFGILVMIPLFWKTAAVFFFEVTMDVGISWQMKRRQTSTITNVWKLEASCQRSCLVQRSCQREEVAQMNNKENKDEEIRVFPEIVVPQNTPKWSFLVGKPLVVGETHHFRKTPYRKMGAFGVLKPRGDDWRATIFSQFRVSILFLSDLQVLATACKHSWDPWKPKLLRTVKQKSRACTFLVHLGIVLLAFYTLQTSSRL